MRKTLIALLVPAFAVTASAQRRQPLRYERDKAPVLQTVTIDIASAFQQHYRAMIEPLVFGRVTVGLSGEYTTEPDEGDYARFVYDACPPEMLCDARASTSLYDPNGSSGYRAWSFNLHARWYPSILSFANDRQSASVYFGEFVGYHERRTTQPIYYGCPACGAPPPIAVDTFVAEQTTPIAPPYPPYDYGTYRQVLRGWEPGAEIGIRIAPLKYVVMDIGARFRLARLDDYQSGTAPGRVESRLVVTAGVGW